MNDPFTFFRYMSNDWLITQLQKLQKENPTDEDINWIRLVLIRRKVNFGA